MRVIIWPDTPQNITSYYQSHAHYSTKFIFPFTWLKTVQLDSVSLKCIWDFAFIGLTHLINLYLSQNEIHIVTLNTFFGISYLRELNLTQTNIFIIKHGPLIYLNNQSHSHNQAVNHFLNSVTFPTKGYTSNNNMHQSYLPIQTHQNSIIANNSRTHNKNTHIHPKYKPTQETTIVHKQHV